MNHKVDTDKQQLLLRLPEHIATRVRKIMNDEQVNEESIDVIQQDEETCQNGDYFTFVIKNEQYPALLENLPTILESHKTCDKKIFLKSGDIGQVLHVFNTEREREIASSKSCKTIHGTYMPNGVTFPTLDIVKKRFERTRKSTETFPVHQVKAVTEEISSSWFVPEELALSGALQPPKVKKSDMNLFDSNGKEKQEVCYSIREEVVPFEDWMISEDQPEGITFKLSSKESWLEAETNLLLEHPELLEFDGDDVSCDPDENVQPQQQKSLKAGTAAPVAPLAPVVLAAPRQETAPLRPSLAVVERPVAPLASDAAQKQSSVQVGTVAAATPLPVLAIDKKVAARDAAAPAPVSAPASAPSSPMDEEESDDESDDSDDLIDECLEVLGVDVGASQPPLPAEGSDGAADASASDEDSDGSGRGDDAWMYEEI